MPMTWHTSKNNAIYNTEIQPLSNNLLKSEMKYDKYETKDEIWKYEKK